MHVNVCQDLPDKIVNQTSTIVSISLVSTEDPVSIWSMVTNVFVMPHSLDGIVKLRWILAVSTHVGIALNARHHQTLLTFHASVPWATREGIALKTSMSVISQHLYLARMELLV